MILRLFEVEPKPGARDALLAKFATTSKDVVLGEAGNQGYFFGHNLVQDDASVVFTSIWEDLGAIKARFGEAWREALLPDGYEDLIKSCSIRHIQITDWQVQA